MKTAEEDGMSSHPMGGGYKMEKTDSSSRTSEVGNDL